MSIKILFLIGLILLYFPLASKKDGLKKYYYLTAIMFIVRELDMASLGDIVPAAVMTTVLFISVLFKSNNLLVGWRPYVFYLLLMIPLALSSSVDMQASLYWVFTLYVTMMLAVMPKYLFSSEEDLVLLMRCVLIICFIFSITSIMAYYGYSDGTVILAGELNDLTNYHASRTYGITSSNLIQIISVISIVLIPFAKIKRKWIEWALIASFMMGALVTLKRMSFIAMITALAYYVYVQKKRGDYRTIIVVVLVCAALIPIFWEAISYRFAIAGFGGNELEDHSTQSRFDRISFAKAAFEQSPIIGMGSAYVIYVHNGFWEILGNCGIVGVLIVLLRLVPKSKDIIELNPWAVAAFLFVLTCFLLESSINHIQMMAFLGLFLGGYFASTNLNINYKIKS